MSDLLLAKVLTRIPVAKSAFDIAYENGFRGTVRDWLESLRGDKGERGSDGINGKDGQQGQRGPQGPQGPTGPAGPMPNHEWKGTELRFELPDGSWGQYVNLQGPAGKGGTTVGAVVVSPNSWEPSGW